MARVRKGSKPTAFQAALIQGRLERCRATLAHNVVFFGMLAEERSCYVRVHDKVIEAFSLVIEAMDSLPTSEKVQHAESTESGNGRGASGAA